MIRESVDPITESQLKAILDTRDKGTQESDTILIDYLFSDHEFASLDIPEGFQDAKRTIEAFLHSPNSKKVDIEAWRYWYALVGLYFLRSPRQELLSSDRRADFARYFLSECISLTHPSAIARQVVTAKIGEEKNKKLNDKKYAASRSLAAAAIAEYPKAAAALRESGQKVTYETVAALVWPRVERFNVRSDGSYVLDPMKDPEGQLIKTFKAAVGAGDIPSTVKLRKDPLRSEGSRSH